MIHCKELEKDFENVADMFKALKEAKDDIINMKKSKVLKSFEKDENITVKYKPLKFLESSKSIAVDDDFYYVAVNSTNILDSHRDLHIKGIWNKSVKEQQGKNYLVDTHKLSMLTTIVDKSDIEMIVSEVPFSALGKSYTGNTEVLIYKFRKDSVLIPVVKEWLESDREIQGSVQMRYTDIELALNSTSKYDKAELATYNKYIGQVANKEEFEEIRYFWVVKQAQNLFESSLVLFGSNSATSSIKGEPLQNTQEEEEEEEEEEEKNEPSNDTQKVKILSII